MLTVGSSRKPALELFPFISLFLCVIGVLAFLQNLLVVGEIGATEEDASQPQIFQTAYRIEAMSDRIVLHPPEADLTEIYSRLNLEEIAGLKSVQAGRSRSIESDGKTLRFEPTFDELSLQLALNEVSSLNLLAKEYGIEYEEFVLLSVHSGGSDTYHYLSSVLDVPIFKHIRSGLELAQPDALQSNNRQDTTQ